MPLWKFYAEKRTRSLGMLPLCWCVPVFLCWGDAPEELWDQPGCAGRDPSPASDGTLPGLLRVGILLSVTRNPSALQSWCLSRLKERNFFSCLVQAAHNFVFIMFVPCVGAGQCLVLLWVSVVNA